MGGCISHLVRLDPRRHSSYTWHTHPGTLPVGTGPSRLLGDALAVAREAPSSVLAQAPAPVPAAVSSPGAVAVVKGGGEAVLPKTYLTGSLRPLSFTLVAELRGRGCGQHCYRAGSWVTG